MRVGDTLRLRDSAHLYGEALPAGALAVVRDVSVSGYRLEVVFWQLLDHPVWIHIDQVSQFFEKVIEP